MLKRSAEAAFGLCCAIWLISLPLHASLWLDELVSYWVIKDGLLEVWSRAVTFQGQSPLYYCLLWAWTQLCGSSEIALRLPSVFCALGCAGLLYRIARLWFDRPSALTAVTLLLTVQTFVIAAVSARPYAPALLLFLAATLVLFSGSGRKRFVLYGALMLACYYTHYLFVCGVLVHLIWAAGFRRVELGVLAATLLLLAGLAIPGWLQIRAINAHADLSFAPLPELGGFFLAIFPAGTLIVFMAALGAGLLFGRGQVSSAGLKPAATVLFLLWCSAGPSIFLILSHLHHGSVFMERYFLWGAAGLALCAASFLTLVVLERDRCMILLVSCVLAACFSSARHFVVEDWRGAAAAIGAQLGSAGGEPILVVSGLIEGRSAEFYAVPEGRAYLFGPLEYYLGGSAGAAVPPNPEELAMQAYLQGQIGPLLAPQPGFYLLARERRQGEKELSAAYTRYFGQQRFEVQSLGDFGEISALHFVRLGEAQHQEH